MVRKMPETLKKSGDSSLNIVLIKEYMILPISNVDIEPQLGSVSLKLLSQVVNLLYKLRVKLLLLSRVKRYNRNHLSSQTLKIL